MNKSKVVKSAVKIAAGLLFSVLLGETYKLSKLADEKIDAYFDDENDAKEIENKED